MNNLTINTVTDGILLVNQPDPPARFSCCNGLILLPRKNRNSSTVVLDVNVEPHNINALIREFGPVSDYVCTHGHMDHITHVHAWEEAGAAIFAPVQEHMVLKGLEHFFREFGFHHTLDFSVIEQFGSMNGYVPCRNVATFMPGDTLRFEGLDVETLPLSGHSRGHVGLFLPDEKVFHISCLGFDAGENGTTGFGPWYGFEECSVSQYIYDIEYARDVFLTRAEYLTSSHSYVVRSPDISPFLYMADRIKSNHAKIGNFIKQTGMNIEPIDELLPELQKFDIFFPKQRMSGFLRDLYTLWEYWILKNHLLWKKTF